MDRDKFPTAERFAAELGETHRQREHLHRCAFAVPLMVGSHRTSMIGLVIYNQAMKLNNMPFAAAITVILLVSSLVILSIYSRIVNRYFLRRLGV